MSNYIPLIILFSVIYLLLIVAIIYQSFKIKELRQSLGDLEKKSAVAATQSQELTEFLRDVQNHGYSFTRVDPDSVLMRSPRNI